MKLSIPLKDIMIAPGKRFDPAEYTEQDVIKRIKKLYGVIAEVMDIAVDSEMAHIEFRDATPEKCAEAMVLTNYAGLMTQKGEFQKAEILFKKAIKIQDVPNAYYGLALLYQMAGEDDASKSVLETMFVRIPQQTLARDHAGIYAEAQNLYGKLSKEKKH